MMSDRRFSDVSDGATETEKAVVIEYLKMVQEFISNCSPGENVEAEAVDDEVADPSPAS